MNGNSRGAHTSLIEVADEFGHTSRPELKSAGISAASVRRLIKNGQLEEVSPKVLRVGGIRPTRLHQIAAACRSLDLAVASHVSAGRLHGLGYLPEDQRVHVTVPPGHSRRSEIAIVHERALGRFHLLTRPDGIVVTTIPRTLLDLAGEVSQQRFDRIADDAIDRKLSTVEEVSSTFDSLQRRGRRGVASTRKWLERRAFAQATESELERLFLTFCSTYLTSTPSTQITVSDELGVIGRIDAVFSPERVAVELDGRSGHQQVTDFEDDRLRDQRLIAAGWIPVRITWDQLRRRPDELATRLAAILKRTSRA